MLPVVGHQVSGVCRDRRGDDRRIFVDDGSGDPFDERVGWINRADDARVANRQEERKTLADLRRTARSVSCQTTVLAYKRTRRRAASNT